MIGFGRAVLAVAWACSISAAAIVGEDDRREWHAVTPAWARALGRATAILIPKNAGYLTRTRRGFRWSDRVPLHGNYDKICSGERFREQPAPGHCSGFLVGPDLFATAYHCLKPGYTDLEVVFDYLSPREGTVTAHLGREQVYEFRSLVAFDEEADWALLRLDRPTRRRSFFRLRNKGEAEAGTAVAMWGSPRGLPLKYADSATVLAENEIADGKYFFETHLDVFGGNSGSPVFSAKDGTLEGILVVAFGEFEEEETDPVTGKACRRLRWMKDVRDATPSWVTRASLFAAQVRAFGKAD